MTDKENDSYQFESEGAREVADFVAEIDRMVISRDIAKGLRDDHAKEIGHDVEIIRQNVR